MSIISFYLFFVSVIIINKKYGIDGYRKIQNSYDNYGKQAEQRERVS